MIAIDSLQIYNSPDVRNWEATATITEIAFVPGAGIHFEFDYQDSWPDVRPEGWEGAIQYTVWLLLNIDGRWCGSGIIECWRGRQSTDDEDVAAGGQIARNWLYDKRWGPMKGHQPKAGERVGFMLTAGDARGRDAHTVAVRTRIVEIDWPARSTGPVKFRWVEPGVDPVSPDDTPVSPSALIDLAPVLAQLSAISKKLDELAATMGALLKLTVQPAQ